MNKEQIMNRLQEHYNIVAEKYGAESVLGVFLYGSQNYNLDDEYSDIDSRAILVPTLSSALFNKPVSKEIILENNEHIDVKDIRNMYECFKKQNVTYIEILFTDYCIINPKYEPYWRLSFKSQRDNIARYDVNRCIQSMLSQLSRHHENDDFYNETRIAIFLDRYVNGSNFKDCIFFQNDDYHRDALMTLKHIEVKENQKNNINFLQNNYSYTQTVNQNMVDDIMKRGIVNMIKINKGEQ